jgi:ribosomal protein S27E
MTWIGLERCTGPACPRCGCQDAEILKRPDPESTTWWASGRARCNHCRREFAFKEIPAEAADFVEGSSSPEESRPSDMGVPFIPVRCPDCHSTDVPVTSSRRPIRWHKCRVCGKTFKSVERAS